MRDISHRRLTAEEMLATIFCQTKEKLRQKMPKFQGVSHYDNDLMRMAAVITEDAFMDVISQQIDKIIDTKNTSSK